MFSYWLRHRFFWPLRMQPPSKRGRLMLQWPAMASHNHPMRLLRMIGTTAGIASTITIIILRHRSNSLTSDKIKRGSRAAPPFAILLCRLRSALTARMFRERLAPRERCAQFWFSSKSGGVMSPPELIELSSPVYSPATPFASKEWANTPILQPSIFVFLIWLFT